uniref:V-set and transmembrane domain containing 4 n=1 Tax=Laticauda laticaudata TaxID=8630 RepID=A0A8C5SNP0_LATLA
LRLRGRSGFCVWFSFGFVDICEALNVTVSPGPRTQHLIGDNVTLCCHVSQKRRRENLLAVRWVFALPSAQEYLMLKMTKFGVVQYYGNYTSHFYRRRLRLLEEKHRTMYKFLILNIQQAEQGHYICKVQEIGKQRNKWTSWSNGSASTEVQGVSGPNNTSLFTHMSAFLLRASADLSVYVVLMCSAGILSILLFSLVTLCQTLSNRRRSHGECISLLPGFIWQPEASYLSLFLTAPTSHAFSKPKLLKPQRKVTLLKGREENLTYAELELLKPHQEVAGASAATVYAQILFQENSL